MIPKKSLKLKLIQAKKGKAKITLIEIFSGAGKQAFLSKKVEIDEDLLFTLDKAIHKSKIEKLLSIRRIETNCGQFKDSISCRLIRVLKKAVNLLQP
jgi:hypothetical protein